MESRGSSLLYLAEKDIVSAGVTMREVIETVEEVYRRHALGQVLMPPKRGINISDIEKDCRTGATAMFAYDGGTQCVGVKWIGENKTNKSERGMPNCLATLLLNDGRSFQPKAILQGLWITGMRTGAETAVGLKYLARRDIHAGRGTISIVGCGAQAKYQLLAVLEISNPADIVLFDANEETLNRFYDEAVSMGPVNGPKIRKAKSADEAVEQGDVVVTVTSTSGSPIVRAQLLKAGALVCAVGSQQEMSLDTVKSAARVIVDNVEQILHSGQLSKWVSAGWVGIRDISGEIGEVIAGKKPGRENDQELIVYMPGGMATLDIAVGSRVLERAKAKNLGLELSY
jgi:ornithine cyclodeaminase/alanine dehydrogenase-like protein (mu-crystallin family)